MVRVIVYEAVKYAPDELKGKSDAELLVLLKKAWGYAPDQPLTVIGEVTTGEGGEPPYFLTVLKSMNDSRLLEYPVDEQFISHNVYISPRDGKSLIGGNEGSVYCKARVQLSPEKERERRRNPLTLQTVPGSLAVLEELPFELDDIVMDEGKMLLERSIVDFYRHKNRAHLKSDFALVKSELEQEQARLGQSVAHLKSAEKQVSEQLNNTTSTLQQTCEQVEAQHQRLSSLTENYQTRKAVMDSQLARLNDFVRDKADTLLRLGFLDQRDMQALLGEAQQPDAYACHDFEQVFGLNDNAAILHIQAFLHARGIYYRQALLKDFLALLRTQDLIVLAGDSGSGKTNLVKSFAQAIGGKAIVVPVKPNWTSTEDLLGYYNPLEKRYITTQFLEALIEAANNPQVPYLICLDEMNLARVEYYFADFLSLLEERSKQPEIFLYSDTEASHVQREYETFLKLVDEVMGEGRLQAMTDFTDLLKDEQANARLHTLCGFQNGESLLKYHSQLRRVLAGLVRTPSSITLPANVRFVGAINVDETTHYLSPKILDRAHVIRFSNPLLFDWQAFEAELKPQELDVSLPVRLKVVHLGERAPYPEFDRNDVFVGVLVDLAREFLSKLGIEFGLRTVRQARNYAFESKHLGMDDATVLNNFVLHKVLPKLMLDGSKKVSEGITRKDILQRMRVFLEQRIEALDGISGEVSCIAELDELLRNAEANDWVVNYWAR